MPEIPLPYLHFLKGSFSALTRSAQADQGLAMQHAISSRLLDYMIVEQTAAIDMKLSCFSQMMDLLPAAHEIFFEQNDGEALFATLSEICTGKDANNFEKFLDLLVELQKKLLDSGRPKSAGICRDLITIEDKYRREFKNAVAVHANAEVNTNASAKNVRSYDEVALTNYIRATFPDEINVRLKDSFYVSGGFSKFTLRMSLADTISMPTRIILRGDADAGYGGTSVVDEFSLLTVLRNYGVRVPAPLALEETGKIFGSPFILVAEMRGSADGNTFNLPRPNKILCDDYATQLASIHKIPLTAFGGHINGANKLSSEKILDWLDEAVETWKSLGTCSPIFETAFDWLRRNASINDEAPRTLVHADYSINNVLVHENRVSAILDWEFAHIGNPAYDLGYFYDMAQALASWDEFLEAYGRAGMPIPEQKQLNYHIIFAATRLGVMVFRTASDFVSGKEAGIPNAAVLGGNYSEEAVNRLASALARVL